MAEVDVPIGTPVTKNIDGALVSDSASRLMNGYLDEEGNINITPGLTSAGGLSNSASIDGIFWWEDISRVILLSNGHIWVVDQSLNKVDLSGSGPLTTMLAGVRPTFATDGTTLYIANGGRIVQTNGANAAQTIVIADADAPTAVTHVIFIDGYILCNEVGTGKIHWSSLNDGTDWSALDFATAEGAPDTIVAVHTFRREIYLFGKLSLEIWENDGETPFARVNGGFIDTGCSAPYSIVKSDNGIIWLSDRKRFVIYSGNGVDSFSTPFDKEIDQFRTVSDCIADRVDENGRTFFIFTFPSQNRTLMYNETNKNWSELGYFNTSTGDFDRWLGNCHAFSPLWNQHLVGSYKPDGLVFLRSLDYTSDNGNPLIMERITGRISYGTNSFKRNNRFTMSAKRGVITDTSEPVMMLSFNDDNRGWGNEIQLSLGKMGDYNNIIIRYRLGMYRNRQYKFRVSDAARISFGSAKEDVYVGER